MTEAQEPETQHEPAVAEPVPARPLEVGELIMLIDRKERRVPNNFGRRWRVPFARRRGAS